LKKDTKSGAYPALAAANSVDIQTVPDKVASDHIALARRCWPYQTLSLTPIETIVNFLNRLRARHLEGGKNGYC
jgi:hypothetical protein